MDTEEKIDLIESYIGEIQVILAQLEAEESERYENVRKVLTELCEEVEYVR